MKDNSTFFEEKVKESFVNVKNDIEKINKIIDNIEKTLKNNKEEFFFLKNELREIKEVLVELRDKKSSSKSENQLKSHHGEQWRAVSSEQWRAMASNTEQLKKQKSNNPNIKNLKEHYTNLFRRLTDREFSIFLAIFELDKQNGETDYNQVANILNITSGRIRDHVNLLMEKGLPIQKERAFNRRTSLFIKKEFKDLHLLQKLLKMRQDPIDQRTLFDLD